MTSTDIDDRPYSDRFYPAQTISSLPRDLKLDDVVLTIDYARQSEVTSLLPTVIQSAIERGDNVGTDEYDGPFADHLTEYSFILTARLAIWHLGSEKSSEKKLDMRHWAVMWTTSEQIAAFIIISPSMFSCTVDPSLADIHVFRTGDVTDAVYTGLVELSIELTRELDVGYMECLISVAATCSNLIDSLIKQLQFTVVLTMPQSVKIAGVEDKLVDNVLLTRNVLPCDYVREPRSLEQVASMLAQHGIADGPEDDAEYQKATLPQVPFLPQKYSLPNDNLVITIRNMYKHEDRLLFNMLNGTVARGEGIALHDLPNLALFRSFLLLEGPCVVLEDSSNGSVMGYAHFSPSRCVRSPQAKYAESTLIIDKPYQNRGLGRVATQLINAMVIQYGYKTIVNDYFSNVRSQRLLSTFATVLGVIPRAVYLVGKGWQEQTVVHLDFSKVPSFTQQIEENQRTSANQRAKNQPSNL